MDTIFVTGATGYIGGRLVPRLLEKGYRVRCLTRSLAKLQSRPWSAHPNVEVIEGDGGDRERLGAWMKGCSQAYYLIHSMTLSGSDFRASDLELARSFAQASEQAGVGNILYLGGLGETGEGLSEHLASRREVEAALRSSTVPVTVFRAAMIIGSGSASFEILRYLVERLPLMVTPRWVRTKCQPIAVRDVLGYLVEALDCEEACGKTFDIGGPDVLTYEELMQLLARKLGLPKRWVIPVPVLTPRLSSLWIHLVTPVDRNIARPLAEGLRNEVVCQTDLALRLLPQDLLTVEEAFEKAIVKEDSSLVETDWTDAGVIPGDPDWAGGKLFEDHREIEVNATAQSVFEAVCRIGGRKGYYGANFLWRLRGVLDRLAGGPGLLRGRKNVDSVSFGDVLDCWRVVGIERDSRLTLRAEMRLPGVAVLEFKVVRTESEGVVLTQTARFRPRGLLGLLYWYSTLPLHAIVFSKMIAGIKKEAEATGPWPTDKNHSRLAEASIALPKGISQS